MNNRDSLQKLLLRCDLLAQHPRYCLLVRSELSRLDIQKGCLVLMTAYNNDDNDDYDDYSSTLSDNVLLFGGM